MISVIKKMSVTNKNEDKFKCECGSVIKNTPSNIRQHKKTLLHKKHENKPPALPATLPDEQDDAPPPLPKSLPFEGEEKSNFIAERKTKKVSDSDKKEQNKLRVQAFRERQRAELGDDKYRENMRTERKASRVAQKAKSDIRVVEDGGQVNPSRREASQTKEDVAQYVSALLTDLNTKKVYNKPAIVQMVKQKLSRFDNKQGAVTNCEQLVSSLDKSSLVNSKYGEIKERSLKDYIRNIKLVYKHMTGEEFDCSNFDFARDIDGVEKAIEEMPKERQSKDGKANTMQSTKTKRYTAFKSILERLDGFHNEAKAYKKLQDESQKVVDINRGTNILSDRESKNWMNWKDIVKYNSANWTDEDRLIHGLYTLLPPRRLEYGLLKLARKKTLPEAQKMDDQFNYIVTNKKNNPTFIILNRYKTDFKYGQYIINLSDSDMLPLFNYSKLVKLIIAFMKNTNEPMVNGDEFFVNSKGNMYINSKGDSSFGSRINYVYRETGKKISVDILRHSFITEFLSKGFSNLTDNTLKNVATALGHSSAMLISYRKLKTPEERLEAYAKIEKVE